MKKIISEGLHHLKWHIAIWPIMGFLGYLLKTLVWPYLVALFGESGEHLTNYAGSHPWRFFGFLVLLACIGTIVEVWNRLKPILVREKQYAQMLEGIGLREFSLHNTDSARDADWRKCTYELERTNPQTLYILGGTGWDTFGSPQSPLHSLLKEFQGTVRILLLKPGADGFSKRINDLNRNPKEFERQINDSVSFCSTLIKDQNKSIEIRLYEDEPIWKMIFTDQYLWLQYYDPKKDVDKTPVYTLQTRDTELHSSLYYPLVRVFQRRWRLSDPVPLTVPPPPYSKFPNDPIDNL